MLEHVTVVQPTGVIRHSKQQEKRAQKAGKARANAAQQPGGVYIAHATPAEAANANPMRARQLKDNDMEVIATFDNAKAAYQAANKDPPQGFSFSRSTQYQQRMTDEEKAVAPINEKTGKLINNKPWTYVYYCCEHLVSIATYQPFLPP